MKNKIIYIIFIVLILFFTISLVTKIMQNDTFFTIPIGEYIVQNGGLDGYDHWSFHENLKFTHSGWIFDLIIYYTYTFFEFRGVYVLILLVAGIISLVLFNTLLKEKNNVLLSFFITLFSVFSIKSMYTARGQLFSFLVFIIELYEINRLLETGKKRHFIILLLLPIILANLHDTVWPIYFIIMLPYIAEIILSKIKILKNNNPYKILIPEAKYGKWLIIVFIISLFTGALTPVFGTPYINMITVMQGLSKDYVTELTPVGILENWRLFAVITLTIMILAFSKTKVRLKDILFIFGFSIMALLAKRNTYFLFLIGSVSLCNIITAFLKEYNCEEGFYKFFSNNIVLIIISIIIILISTNNLTRNMNRSYVDDTMYPIEATQWLLENTDVNNIKLYNHYNFGSYLELNKIPVFIDSRSGIYCKEFNDTEVMQDYMDLEEKGYNYEEIFEKYGITHILIYDTQAMNRYIFNDDNYNIVYQDDIFVIYERNN